MKKENFQSEKDIYIAFDITFSVSILIHYVFWVCCCFVLLFIWRYVDLIVYLFIQDHLTVVLKDNPFAWNNQTYWMEVGRNQGIHLWTEIRLDRPCA